MKILFLIYHGFSEYSGISKKIRYQINGLKKLSHEVHVCTYDITIDNRRIRSIDNNIIQDFGKSILSSMRKRCEYKSIIKYVTDNKIDFVYSRSFHNANPFTINMFHQFKKHGIKTVIEIPTYPYDHEYAGMLLKDKIELFVDKMYRKKLAKETDAIVTFTNDNIIFGQRTIRISNGIEFESIALKQNINDTSEQINFITVAEVHYWHGFDRFIHGIGEYYKNGGNKEIYFHIIGGIATSDMNGTEYAPGLKNLIEKYNIGKHVIFHGPKFGKELDDLFEQCDFAIGSLARHRCGIKNIKTLKNREYAARGIPFAYSEIDDDFDNMPYVLKVPADESYIDINSVISFYEGLTLSPKEIRNTISFLSWTNQMNTVLNEVYYEQKV